MPLDIRNILSSSINDSINLKKTNNVSSVLKNVTGGGDVSSVLKNVTGGGDVSSVLKNITGGNSNINSLIGNILPVDYIENLKNLNLDISKITKDFDLLSNLNIDKNKINEDFLKINKSGLKFTSITDLKKQDLSKLNLDKNFIQNLDKMSVNGLDINNLFNSFTKLNTIGGPNKVDDLVKKVNDWLNLTNSSKNSNSLKAKREKIKLPNPGETLTLTIYEDQLPELDKILKNEKFSKLFGDNFKSVLNLISPDSNISTDDNFVGKYILSYFVGNKSESWDIAQKGATDKVAIDKNQISLTSDYNKNVDMITHHIHIALLKNIKPVEQKLSKDTETVTKFEKNLYIDRERGIKILVPSQYIDVFQTSKWGGYKSFVTTKFSRQLVWYDNSYDRPDFYPSNITKPVNKNRDGSSNFDIGVHIGQPGGKTVGSWSDDGSHCFATTEGINEFFELCDKHTNLYGNKFTYTLATKDDFEKAYRDDQIVKEERRKREEELARRAAELRAQQQAQQAQNNTVSTVSSTPDILSQSNTNVSKSNRTDESSCPNHDCWTHFGKEAFWNGVSTINGKKVPEIKIQKSTDRFTISYKGPASGFLLRHGKGGKGDTAHQLLNVFTAELNPHLKQYKLKPLIKSLLMEVKGNTVVVSVPLVKSPSGKAYLIDRRGGWGWAGNPADLKKHEGKPNYEMAKYKSGPLTEYFVTVENG
jgi:hypothetical protein